jgi:hypothetical protein
MIIRVLRALPKPGHTASELARLAKAITIPFVATKPDLVARYMGRGPLLHWSTRPQIGTGR